MNELLTLSTAELARRIKNRQLSPVEVVDAHIKRIEEVNPKLNAVIHFRFDKAREEARAADERIAQGGTADLPPLFGVPCTIKESFAMKGFPWTVGIWARKDVVADFDAITVKRLQDAGAIILGRTNIPEGCMWCETYNKIYGRTNNPYDLGRTVGGSSGGEGAIVGAGGAPFGLAADVGGSIRYPSAFNGVAGHKPTGGLVPGTGCIPIAEGALARYCTYGPIARRVEDLKLILPILAGPDGIDKSTIDEKVGDPDSVDLSKTKIFYYDYNGLTKPGPDVKRAMKFAANALTDAKLNVSYWRPEGVEKGLEIWQAGMAQNPHPYDVILGDGKRVDLGREFIKQLTGNSKLTFIAWITALIEKPGQLMKGRNSKVLKFADELQKRIEEKLGDNGVLICPVFPVPAPKHNHIWMNLPGIGYSGIFNVLHFPATIIPIYHRPDGLPVSVQVVSGRCKDHVTLAVAAKLEEIFGGWKPPKNI